MLLRSTGSFIDMLASGVGAPFDITLPNPTPQFPEDPDITILTACSCKILEGSLSHHDLGMWWTKFLIITDRELQWYKKKDNTAEGDPDNVLNLKRILEVKTSEKQKFPGAFEIHMKGGGREKFCARDADERDLWMQKLNKAVHDAKVKVDDRLSASSLGNYPDIVLNNNPYIAFISTGAFDHHQGSHDVIWGTFPSYGEAVTLTLQHGTAIHVYLNDGQGFNLDPQRLVDLGGTVTSNNNVVQKLVPTDKEKQDDTIVYVFQLAKVSQNSPPPSNDSRPSRSKPKDYETVLLLRVLCIWQFGGAVLQWLVGLHTSWLQCVLFFGCCWPIFQYYSSSQFLGMNDRTDDADDDEVVGNYTLMVTVTTAVHEDPTTTPSDPILNQTTEEEQASILLLQKDFADYKPITIRRFLRSQHGNVDLAHAMLKHNQQFRASFGPITLKNLETELRMGFFYFHGRAHDGTPLLVFRFANIIVKDTSPDQFVRLIFAINKLLFEKYEGECATAICDFKGFGVRKNVDMAIYKKIIETFGTHFPETVHRVLAINVTQAQLWIWNTLKPFVSQETLTRIKFLNGGTKQLRNLMRYIDPANIPAQYGGTSTYDPQCCLQATSEDPMWGCSDDKAVAHNA